MKKSPLGIESVLHEIVELLQACDEHDKASWFREKVEQLRLATRNSSLKNQVLEEIQTNLTGMGSFADISLCPRLESGLSRREARQKQWDLVEEFDHAIKNSKA
jgi:hypothetical protein